MRSSNLTCFPRRLIDPQSSSSTRCILHCTQIFSPSTRKAGLKAPTAPKRKRPRLRLESWDALETVLPRKLLNSNLGSAPKFENSPCVPRGGTAGLLTRRCDSHRLLALPNIFTTGTVHGIGRLSLG